VKVDGPIMKHVMNKARRSIVHPPGLSSTSILPLVLQTCSASSESSCGGLRITEQFTMLLFLIIARELVLRVGTSFLHVHRMRGHIQITGRPIAQKAPELVSASLCSSCGPPRARRKTGNGNADQAFARPERRPVPRYTP
jgi:hypothetical protein